MTIEQLRDKCLELMELDKDKYQLIYDMLEDDDLFSKIDINMAYSILNDLEVEDIKNTYIELMKRK